MNDLLEQSLNWLKENVLLPQPAEVLVDAGHVVCQRLKSDHAWNEMVVKTGQFFVKYENTGDAFYVDLSVILSEKNMRQLAAVIKDDPGYSKIHCQWRKKKDYRRRYG